MKKLYKINFVFAILISVSANAQNPADRDVTFDMFIPPSLIGFSNAAIYRDITFQADGKVLYSGGFYHIAVESEYSGILRLNTDGSYDDSFSGAAGGIVSAVAVQEDGKILIGGGFGVYNGEDNVSIVRVFPDGSIDETFNSGTGATSILLPWIRAIAVQQDGKIIIGGAFTSYDGHEVMGITRLNSDGSRDETFNAGEGTDHAVEVIRLLPNGQILAAGRFDEYNGVETSLALINPDGSADPDFAIEFNVGNNAAIYDIEITADGKIIVVGSIGDQGNGIIQLLPDGTVDPEFSSGMGPTMGSGNGLATIFSAAIQDDGKILIAGSFDKYDLTDRGGIARLNPDGSLDPEFNSNPGYDGWAYDIKISPTDGKIYSVGGASYQEESLWNEHTPTSGHYRDVIRLMGSGGAVTASENLQKDIPVLYPNPAQDHINFQNISKGYDFDITSPDGKIIMKGTVQDFDRGIDISALPAGAYLIHLRNGSHDGVHRLIKL